MRNQLKLLGAVALAAVTSLAAMTAGEAQTRLRIAGNFPDEHTATKAIALFKEEVEKLTNNELQVDTFPAMQLGGAQENVDQVRSGAIFGLVASISYFTRSVPEFEALSLPFQFDTRETAFKVIDGEVGGIVNEKLAERGFLSLGYGENGYRHLTNNVRPVATIKDFEGLKIRLQPNEVHLATFKALGANPVAMDIKELYSALQQGVLDGQENPYSTIATRRFAEVQKYISGTGHFFDYITVVANKRAFEKLSPEHQEAVRTAMTTALKWQRAEEARRDLEWRDKLVSEGMQFNEVSAEARAEMREATKQIAEDLKGRIGADILDRIAAEAAK